MPMHDPASRNPALTPDRARRMAIRTGALLLAACGFAQAGAREDVEAAMNKLLAASSWHATMQVQGKRTIRNELDFAAPDRYRIKVAGLGVQYIIGDSMFIDLHGHTRKLPLPEGTLGRYRDPAQLGANRKAMAVKALGNDSIDGKPARKYRIHNQMQANADVLMWIDGNAYPLQIRVAGKDSVVTMRYSRFNDPTIRVQAPQ